MRNEFFLEDNDQDQDLFEHTQKSRRWRPSWTFLFIILAIAGGSAITYFMTQPTSDTLTAQATPNPQPEPVKEIVTDSGAQAEPAEPALVEPYRGDQSGFPELIAQVPTDDTNPTSKENKNEQVAVKPGKQKLSDSQTPTASPEKGIKVKQATLNPEKQTVFPTPKHQTNPTKKPPIKITSSGKQVSDTHTQKTITPQTNHSPKIMKQMTPDHQKQTTSDEKEASSPQSVSNKSVQWIVPTNPEGSPSNQSKNTFQLEPYLLNQEGKLIPLLSTKASESKDPLKSNLIPLIQIESPTRFETFLLQMQNIQTFITQSTASEIHILLIDGQKETPEGNNNIQTILTSLIHQSTKQANKKLILHKPTTESTPSYFPLLEIVDGLQFSIKTEPILTFDKKWKQTTTSPFMKSIQSWSVKQAFNITNDQLTTQKE
ncbi:hypothetical protein [Baia soyae]|uniref:Uncharacterized protein n=1 Tax=Baia soyae TaxID=1544746 RepID=A0A4R2RMX9_9BACL|nr:hypothetical protein [Baia soyae]TCP64019.1 hypothetical protein EDD57_1447 [Baia soyae]